MKLRLCIAMVAVLMVCLAGGLVAQTTAPTPLPDAGVRGAGTIRTPDGVLGDFSVNVIRAGAVLTGNFRYQDANPNMDRSLRRNVVYAKAIKSLVIHANTTVVEAEGEFNGQPARLTLEAVDNGLAGDSVRISAAPIGLLPYIWSVGGKLSSGDLFIWEKPVSWPVAKGAGTISVQTPYPTFAPVEGVFQFQACPTLNAMPIFQGSLTFYEGTALPNSSVTRPNVKISVSAFSSVVVMGNRVTMRGPGTMNGLACMVEAVGIDNARIGPVVGPPTVLKPDWFEIRVFRALSATSAPSYQAVGPVVKGDIVVGAFIR